MPYFKVQCPELGTVCEMDLNFANYCATITCDLLGKLQLHYITDPYLDSNNLNLIHVYYLISFS